MIIIRHVKYHENPLLNKYYKEKVSQRGRKMDGVMYCIIERLPFIRCNFFCTYRKQRILAEQYSTNTYSIYCILYCRESNPNYVIYSWHATKLGIEYLTAFISCCTTIGKCDWNKNIFFIFLSWKFVWQNTHSVCGRISGFEPWPPRPQHGWATLPRLWVNRQGGPGYTYTKYA